MIKITKDGKVQLVSKSAFDNFFKSQGWVIGEAGETPPSPIPLKEEKPVELSEAPEAVEEDDSEEWDDILEELNDSEAEKPLSEMTKKELVEKAKSLGIALSGSETNKQLREAIKSVK